METTHFGYQQVPVGEKAQKVAEVFTSVANRYDLMNDLMSLGAHRLWKRFAMAVCAVRAGDRVLDLGGGTGDLSRLLHTQVGPRGHVVLSDINPHMLAEGRRRCVDAGITDGISYAQIDAEQLPFADNTFDCVTMGFSLRNVTDKDKALQAVYRVLKPGGKAVILEFSHLTTPALQPAYDLYSFTVLPALGEWITHDADSYRYLAESIRMHPDQETLLQRMEAAGFERCQYFNLTVGIVAVHRGYKF